MIHAADVGSTQRLGPRGECAGVRGYASTIFFGCSADSKEGGDSFLAFSRFLSDLFFLNEKQLGCLPGQHETPARSWASTSSESGQNVCFLLDGDLASLAGTFGLGTATSQAFLACGSEGMLSSVPLRKLERYSLITATLTSVARQCCQLSIASAEGCHPAFEEHLLLL